MSDRKVMLVVAGHARDAADCRQLLDMLGLALPKPRRAPGRPTVDHGHGDHRTYIKGCRCTRCREAMRVRAVEKRAAWRSAPSAADRAGHGKLSTYKNYGCRCEPCKAANTEATRAGRAARREKAALAETGGAR
ncbi:hypothetical protein [Streptomyces sp. NPDC057413]|uniref:hypothetical protein n=1 Tax=Streptomyces sp. NPDC057413 TaxID=3346124 RepID=UPI0036AA1704